MHGQYFALIYVNLKLQFCAQASFSLLLILLGCVRQWAECGELNTEAQNILGMPETDILIP